MRTSNKILLSVFLAAVIIVVTVHVTLYAKYRNSDFIIEKLDKPAFAKHELTGINCISLNGLGNVEIRYSDTARVETEEGPGRDGLRFKIRHDTLEIFAEGRTNNINTSEQNYQRVIVYLSALKNINATYCSITLKGSNDSAKAINYKVDCIDDVQLSVADKENSEDNTCYFKALDIKAGSSTIGLHSGAYITNLNVFLKNSDIIDQGATIVSINVDADNGSAISLRGGNFKKLRIP